MDNWTVADLKRRVEYLEDRLEIYARANEEQHRRSLRMHNVARQSFSAIAFVATTLLVSWLLDKWLPGWVAFIIAFIGGGWCASLMDRDYEKAEGDYSWVKFPRWLP